MPLKSNNLSLNEATDVAQNRPLWRLMSTFGATHSFFTLIAGTWVFVRVIYQMAPKGDFQQVTSVSWAGWLVTSTVVSMHPLKCSTVNNDPSTVPIFLQ